MGPEYPHYYPDHDIDSMIGLMDECGIDFIISSPCEDLFYAGTKHKVIIHAMKKYPERVKGYYGINPRENINTKDIIDAFKKNSGYVGFKLLPDYHRTVLSDSSYAPVFELADKNHMLVLSHTWGLSMNNESCNSADEVIRVLDKYQNIIFIMGHSIQGQIDKAIKIASNYPNAYLDICDSGRINGVIEKMIKKAGGEKIIFGSDSPMHSASYLLGAVLGARINDDERKLILRDNALQVLSRTGRP
jgi:predicted TIM-barrel fold metal-dependent hydrolase